MDLTTMRTNLRAMVNNPTTTVVPDSELTGDINSGYKNIASRYRFHGISNVRRTFNTVIGQISYSLASDVLTVHKMWNRSTNNPLGKIDEGMLSSTDGTTQYPNETGEPFAWYRNTANALSLFPPPDAIYAIEYVCKIVPTALSADGDTPILPETWHEGIQFMARWYYFDRRGDYPKAQYAMNAFKLWLSDKSTEVEEESVALEESVDVMPSRTLNQLRLSRGDNW